MSSKLILALIVLVFLLAAEGCAVNPDIYVIGFGIPHGSHEEAALMDLARTNNGTYLSAENATTPEQLQEVLGHAYRGVTLTSPLKNAQTVVDGATYIWTKENMPGFYYDIDNDIGTERLEISISDNQIQKPRGAIYTSTAQAVKFKFEGWGSYKIMGFLGDKYFAGYSDDPVNGADPFLYKKSDDASLLAGEGLTRVLINDDSEITITNRSPLYLKDGYRLAIKSVDDDGKKAYLELSQDGQSVDIKTIQPSSASSPSSMSSTEKDMDDSTYYYKRDIGSTNGIVTIAVHFKDAYRSGEESAATVGGIFQISDRPISVNVRTVYGRMRVESVDDARDTITMDNKDNTITLNKNTRVELMPDFWIKTSDQEEVTDTNPLRFYIYRAWTIIGSSLNISYLH